MSIICVIILSLLHLTFYLPIDLNTVFAEPAMSDDARSNAPTLGHNSNNTLLVTNGFEYNNQAVNANRYKTVFPFDTNDVDDSHTIKLKIYDDSGVMGIKRVDIALDVPDVGLYYNAESFIEIWMESNELRIKEIVIEGSNIQVDSVSVIVSTTSCAADNQLECLLVELRYSFIEPSPFDIIAVRLHDIDRNSKQFYFVNGYPGAVSFDSSDYNVLDDVTVTLTDEDLNINSGAIDEYEPIIDPTYGDIVVMSISSENRPMLYITVDDAIWNMSNSCVSNGLTIPQIGLSNSEFILKETSDDSGIFTGMFKIPPTYCNSNNLVEETFGKILKVHYIDYPILTPINDDATITLSNDGDLDGDGLINTWELHGVDINDDGIIDLNLSELGAHPYHKDLFLEIDYMEYHRPSDSVVNNVIQAFNNSPVVNPSGHTGINLHILIDEEIEHRDNIPFTPRSGIWEDFDRLKTTHFGTEIQRENNLLMQAKNLTYRYGIFAHQYDDWISSGLARGIHSNDFLVTLGGNGWGIDNRIEHTVGSQIQQEGTLMHELGHTLSLRHGGGDDINSKPNYLSVMSYLRQTGSLYPQRSLDYSNGTIITLNESSLDESVGIPGNYNTITHYYHNELWRDVKTDGDAVDWNQNGTPDDVEVMKDINGDNRKTNLHGFNDWESGIQYNLIGLPAEMEHVFLLSHIESILHLLKNLDESAFYDKNITHEIRNSIMKDVNSSIRHDVENMDYENAINKLLEIRNLMDGNGKDDVILNNHAQKLILTLDTAIHVYANMLNTFVVYEVNSSIIISTDKYAYDRNSSIFINGKIDSVQLNTTNTYQVIDEFGSIIIIDEIIVNKDGTYRFILDPKNKVLRSDGSYIIRVNSSDIYNDKVIKLVGNATFSDPNQCSKFAFAVNDVCISYVVSNGSLINTSFHDNSIKLYLNTNNNDGHIIINKLSDILSEPYVIYVDNERQDDVEVDDNSIMITYVDGVNIIEIISEETSEFRIMAIIIIVVIIVILILALKIKKS